MGFGVVALQLFNDFKTALELLVYFQMDPLQIFYNHLLNTIIPRQYKQDKTNNYEFLIVLLANNPKSHMSNSTW